MSDTFHSIIGLPRSGKTTFLAALWHLINAGEVASRLTLDRLDGDSSYLNSIVEFWQRCEEVPRTSLAAETRFSIHFRIPATNEPVTISFPDLSGESFEQQIAARSCEAGYIEGCNKRGGILLFVTTNRPVDGVSIVDLIPLDGVDANIEPVEGSTPWAPELMPIQVRLVELLQFLQRPPFERRRRRLAVVISAWDLLPTPSPEPLTWLEREMPLLHQFLQTNSDTFEVQVYGVSAQGGDVTSGARGELLKQMPSQRITLLSSRGSTHDLTEPIIWLMQES